MSFKPLKDDEQLQFALEQLSRVSERCAIATEAINRATREHGPLPEDSKLMQEVSTANRDRKNAKQQILTLVNERMSSAYRAGLDDGVTQTETK